MHCHLSLPIWKFLLNKPVGVDDLYNYDSEIYNSTMDILRCPADQIENLYLTFSVDEDHYGQIQTKNLIPNGSNIDVTADNRAKYIKELVYYKLFKQVQQQLLALRRGVTDIVHQRHLIQLFNHEMEFEIAINGIVSIDISDWKRNTLYKNCNNSNVQIQWFWDILRNEFDDEEQNKFLHFCTGSSRAPLDGFKNLKADPDKDEPKLFSILLLDRRKNRRKKVQNYQNQNNQDANNNANNENPEDFYTEQETNMRLPKSHTCFNRLDLPPYTSRQAMLEKMRYCIENQVGFGIE